ncbi:FAD binding domain-containing protein [Salibacterium aidingense]|uniref:FAD binding domain-containing protein n=1 Tax=Salibacterium aidingense TaxID=384933 RepID=UPI000478FAB8|nr:FAD binding domain-containing protein [Salibacterium aidingense]
MAAREYAVSGRTKDSPVIWFPREVEEAWEQKRNRGENASFIAGGTVIQMQREQGVPCPSHLISLENINEMNGIVRRGSYLRIGALNSLADVRKSHEVQQYFPCLAEAVRNIAAPAVRNRGTIGGNLMYEKGDTVPAFLVLDASVSYFYAGSPHTLPVLDFLENKVDGLVTAFWIPYPTNENRRSFSFYNKVGRRESFSLSVVNAAGRMELGEDGRVQKAALAAGGGNIPAQCLEEVKNRLCGSHLSLETLQELYSLMLDTFTPPSDDFFSAAYKQKTAANLILSQLYSNAERNGGKEKDG